MLRKTASILVLMGLPTLLGCGLIRARAIRSELQELEPQRELSQQVLNSLKQRTSSLQDQSNELAGRIRNRESEVATYMQEHWVAVGCMAATGYSLGKDNLFSEDVNKAINTGTFLCVAGVVVSEAFRQEVANVVEELEQADPDIKDLRSQIISIKLKIDEEKLAWTSEKAKFDALSEKIKNLNSELKQLE